MSYLVWILLGVLLGLSLFGRLPDNHILLLATWMAWWGDCLIIITPLFAPDIGILMLIGGLGCYILMVIFLIGMLMDLIRHRRLGQSVGSLKS